MQHKADEVTVRGAGAADAGVVAALLGELGYPATREQAAARLARIDAEAGSAVVVAEAHGDVAGLAAYRVFQPLEHDEPCCHLSAIVVAERFRGRGVGAALVAAVEAAARGRGCTFVFLSSGVGRADAHAFYRRLGFEETGRRFVKRFRP